MERASHDLIVSTISEHAESLLRVARRHTRCHADAEDAYQRALEIFVKQAHRLEPATVHRWLHTVLKHECWAVCEQRARYVGVADDEALDALDDGRHLASVEERSERFEELSRAAEALRRLKPQEVTALVLKAQGLSYDEIAAREGWTYTKVNRCLTEGRRAFLQRYAGIQSGEECARWLPVLSAMADGEATSEQLIDARPHLRNCPACRSMLGDLHRSSAPVAALLPPAIVGAAPSSGLLDRLGEIVIGLQERIAAPVVKAQTAIEAASSLKFAAVAASSVAIAGGGAVVAERPASDEPVRTAAPAPVERTIAMEAPPAAPKRRPEPVAKPKQEPPPTPETPPADVTAEFAPEQEVTSSPEFAAPAPEAPIAHAAASGPAPAAESNGGEGSEEFGFGG